MISKEGLDNIMVMMMMIALPESREGRTIADQQLGLDLFPLFPENVLTELAFAPPNVPGLHQNARFPADYALLDLPPISHNHDYMETERVSEG